MWLNLLLQIVIILIYLSVLVHCAKSRCRNKSDPFCIVSREEFCLKQLGDMLQIALITRQNLIRDVLLYIFIYLYFRDACFRCYNMDLVIRKIWWCGYMYLYGYFTINHYPFHIYVRNLSPGIACLHLYFQRWFLATSHIWFHPSNISTVGSSQMRRTTPHFIFILWVQYTL